MLTIIVGAVCFVAGLISCAVWLKATDRLKAKVTEKVADFRRD